mgnify:FL=1|jgi:hypothetical protein
MMKASEFVAKAVDIAKNYKTLYVMGCFGAPMTAANKKRYTQNHEYNRRAARTAMINAASAETFGFDCVNLIKGILWGWCGDASRQYGGSGYAINGVPDIGADSMITKCPDASASGWDKVDPGEAVWCKGHIGIYIGDGLAVECTPSWANKVQITAVGNIGAKSGYKTRKWTKHGHLPYVEYDTAAAPVKPSAPATPTPAPAAPKQIKASGAAKSFDRSLAGTYTVTASSLNVRDKAGATDQIKILTALPSGAKVQNYGYYTLVGKVKWLYVQFTRNGVTYTGFCSEKYLRK